MSTVEGPLKHQSKKGGKLNVRLVKAYKQQAILDVIILQNNQLSVLMKF